MKLKLAGIEKESIVDGPGIRFVVFTQGCPHKCKGCHNPQTWDYQGGENWYIEDLLKEIKKVRGIKGVTFSGGEPFDQAEALVVLAKEIKKLGLDIVTYTGYIFEEILALGEINTSYRNLLNLTDILIDGPYMDEYRDLDLPFRGSSNQRVILVKPSLESKKTVVNY